MEWTYIWGVSGILASWVGVFLAGWRSGHASGRKKGFYEGWEDGCDHTKQQMTEEFNKAFPDPFRKRLLDSNRRVKGRPNSVGPIRVHMARIRGDRRLPANNPNLREPIRPQLPKSQRKPADEKE